MESSPQAPSPATSGTPRHRASGQTFRPGRRGLLALPASLLLARPALAQGSKRPAPASQPIEAIAAAVRIIQDSHVDPVPLRPMLENGLAALSPFAPPPGKRGSTAPAEARRALAEARSDAEAVAALVAAIRQLGGEEIGPLSPLLTATLRGMAKGLDPHSDYLPPDAPGIAPPAPAIGGIGLEVAITGGQVTVVRPLPGGPSEGRIRPGDILLALDGRSLAGLPLAEVVGRMRGPVGTELGVTLRRGFAETVTLAIPRRPVSQPGLRSLLLGRTAYLRPEAFRETSRADLRAAIATLSAQAGGGLEGLVLDLRENSGGLLDAAAAIAADLLPAGQTVATLSGRTEANSRPLQASGDQLHGLPLIVLVNDGTAAGAEIVAGALRDHRRAPLVGRRSFGDGTVSTVFPLAPTGGALRITTARVTLPSGRGFDGAGLLPDLTVEATKGSVAARLQATRNRSAATRPAPSPAPAWPALEAALRGLHPPEGASDPMRPEADPEMRQALALLRAVKQP